MKITDELRLQPMNREPRRRPLAGLAMGLVLVLGPGWFLAAPAAWAEAHSDEGTEEAIVELSLEELMQVEVVYAASRYEQTLLEAPSAVTIVSADEIEAFGYRTLGDVLSGTRGVFVTYDRNWSSAAIRGFGRPGDVNSRFLLLVDGHRLNDNIFDAASVGGDFPIHLDLIERIEIVRGPTSSLYGTNAFFGVVNVVLRQGADLDGLRLTAEAGSFDTRSTRVDYGRRLDSGLDVLVSASFLDSGGQDHYFSEFDDPGTNNGVADSADREEIEHLFAQVARGGFRLQAVASAREKGVPTASYETVFNDPRTRTTDATDWLAMEYSRPAKRDGVGFLGRFSYNRYEEEGDYVYDYGEEDDPYLVVNRDRALGDWWGAEFEIVKRLRAGHALVAGVEYRDNVAQEQSNFDEEVYLDDKRSSHAWASFVQGEVALGDDWKLHAGLRYDHGETVEGPLSPRLALIWLPREASALKLLYGESFRAPNVYELFYHDGEETQKASLRLDEEKISTLEVVWEQKLGSWRGLVSVYHYEIDDLIDLTTDPSDDLLVFRNLDKVEADGLEVEAEREWRGGLFGRASYAYQEAESVGVEEGLSNSPRHLGTLQLRGTLLDDRLSVGTEIRHMSDRLSLGGGVAGAHTLANLTLSTRLSNDGLRLSLGLYNLLDERYADPASEEHEQDLIRQDGRSWRLKLTYRH